MKPNRFSWIWPIANIRHRKWMSMATTLGVAVAVYLASTLLGFVSGYEQAVRRDVDRMGFDFLVTARGCPYEAATLMLRGGVGLRYMPDGVVEELDTEVAVAGTYPTLVHPIRDQGSEMGMMLLQGVVPEIMEVRGLELSEGEWLEEGVEGVVLGYEAAELEGRHAGDPFLLPGDTERPPMETQVVGVLSRTGSQLDGSVLMELSNLQELFGMEHRLTGVGVRVHSEHRDQLDELKSRYESEPELQVVTLSSVVLALHRAMSKMQGLVRIMATVLVVMAAAVLVNAGLLRSLADRGQHSALLAVGLPARFVALACFVENLVLTLSGTTIGLLSTIAFRGAASDGLAGFLPYTPSGELIVFSFEAILAFYIGAVILAGVATIPSWIRLRFFEILPAMGRG